MLGLAEYRVLSVQLQQLGAQYDEILAQQTTGLGVLEATKVAKSILEDYNLAYRNFLRDGLDEIALNAATYYQDILGTDLNLDIEAWTVVDSQYNDKYYNYTLKQRLQANERRMARLAVMTARVGRKEDNHFAGFFSKLFPFGAQTNFNRRLLQGTAVKVEQDMARRFAHEAEHPLIKWNLSGRHGQPDMCDVFSQAVDERVAQYIREHDLKLDPAGIYFKEDLPLPPHPNCQCEYGLARAGKASVGPVKRTITKIKDLLRRLRGK